MAYDPEARLRYAREQRIKRKLEEEKVQIEECKSYSNDGENHKINQKEKMYVESDHPSTMENGTATLLYIIVMIVGAIFVDRWLIWFAATIIYSKFINRKKIRQEKWDKIKKKNGGHK